MQVTPATPEELDTILELWLALAVDQREYGSHIEVDANRQHVRESLAHAIVADEILVARSEDTLCGFVTFSLEFGDFEQDVTRGIIENIYVRPADRGSRIGEQLLDAGETALAERGAETVFLETMAKNEDAHRFYRRHGYEPHRIEFEKTLGDETDGGETDDG